MGEFLPALGRQGRLQESTTCPMADALELGKTPTPYQEKSMGESSLLQRRWLWDIPGRRSRIGATRCNPNHPLHKGHRKKLALGSDAAPIRGGAQEATSGKGNLQETTADVAPKTRIEMRPVSHPVYTRRRHSNGSYQPHKSRWNRRPQQQTSRTPLVPSATSSTGRATTAKGLSRMKGNRAPWSASSEWPPEVAEVQSE